MTVITNDTKINISISNESKPNALTWDEATFTWDEAIQIWDETGATIISNETKNSISITNENKNV